MPERRPGGRFTLLALGLTIALMLAAPLWVAADTGTVTPVGVGASVTFSGSGFAPNETLSVWTTAPDGTPSPLPSGGVQTDASGGFSVTVSFPSAGPWLATAHSINSGKEIVNHYDVGTTGTTAAPVTGVPSPVTSGAPAPGFTPVGVGASVTFSGSNFTAGEAINLWETPPNGGAVITLPSTGADSAGAFTTTVSFPSAGNWQITAHGGTSLKEIVGRYAVGTTGTTTAPVTNVPVTSGASAPPGFTPIASGSPVTFSGSGFTAAEAISLWETPPNGGAVITLPGTGADSAGAFTTTVTFPSDGNWQITAHGVASLKEVVGRYAVGTSAPVTNAPVTSGVAPPGFTPIASGAAATFSGSGFTANEVISLWETSPTSVVTALPGTGADSAGAFTTTVTFPSDGNWQITAHGVTSLKEIIGRYAVGSTTGTTSGSTGGFSNVPAVTLGSPITFSGAGFNGGEPISLWETPPSGGTPTTLPGINADGIGGFTTTVTFPSAGNWQITAHGRDSAHEVIGRYTITTDASATTSTTASAPFVSPYTGIPLKATAGSVVTFSATGFNAGETITAWSTGPDGKVLPVDTTQASSAGRATVSVSFSTTGIWQVTLHGRDSTHEVVGKYQVVEATQAT